MSLEGTVVREGSTDIVVPEQHSTHGPGKKIGPVFFNEQMSFNRDVSVMLLRALGRDRLTVVDAMAATGSRSVRIANEVPGSEVVANDISPDAIPWIERNIAANGLDNCTASNMDMNVLLAERTFDYVDLDPFGSPMTYIQSAVRGAGKRGIMAITATDMAPLAGAHAVKCRRRYQCEPVRGYMCHEGAVRILMCNVARELAKFDRGMRPILSFYADHYYRTYVQVEPGADAADRTLAQLGYMSYTPGSLERSASAEIDDAHRLGPFWLGPLHDQAFLRTFDPSGTADEKRCRKYLDLWINELDDQPFVYDVSELSSATRMSPPKIADLVAALRERGRASPTHFSPTEFMTDLPLDDILEVYRSVSPDAIGKH